ncbi:CDP-alcohol phosphatidyltransferase family protein [Sphaerisporangium melleum]|nr:CDP-alcohol phosphatidyltransferase family protein [Sphaerisporangium melleum]
MRSYSLDDVLATRKRRDSWWTVFMVDPVACRVALFVANRTEITPNALTRCSLVLGMVSAACFAANHLVLGAGLFYLSFMIDCVDGKIARLKGTGTPFGLWLDYVGDRIRVVCCAAGLAYGQYTVTGRMAYVLLGAGIAVLDLFRYVNGPQMKRVRQTVKARRRAARREELAAVRDAMAVESLTQEAGYAASYGIAAAPGEPLVRACHVPRDAHGPDDPHDVPDPYDPCDPYDQMADLFEETPPSGACRRAAASPGPDPAPGPAGSGGGAKVPGSGTQDGYGTGSESGSGTAAGSGYETGPEDGYGADGGSGDRLAEPYGAPLIPRQASPSSEYDRAYLYDSGAPFDQNQTAPFDRPAAFDEPDSFDRTAPFDQVALFDQATPLGRPAPYGRAAAQPPAGSFDKAAPHDGDGPFGPAYRRHVPRLHLVPQPPEAEAPPIGLRRRLVLCLTRHRVRTHLMSGIEFHAAVFVAGPLLGPAALLPVTVGAGLLLVLNEIFLVYRMWQSTRAVAPDPAHAASGPDGERHVRTDPFFTGV